MSNIQTQFNKNEVIRDNFTSICDRVAEGDNLGDIAKDMDLKPYDLTSLIYKDEDLLARFEAARQARGEALLKKIDETLKDLRSHIISDKEAKVLVDTYKWMISKLAPRTFGDGSTLFSKGEEKKGGGSTNVVIKVMGSSQVPREVEEGEFTVEASRPKLRIAPTSQKKPGRGKGK